MFITLWTKVGFYAALAVGGFMLGASWQGSRDRIEMLELQNSIQTQSLQAEQQIREKTQELLQATAEATEDGQKGIDRVHERFTNLMLGLSSDRMPNGNGQGSLQMPDTPTHTGDAQPNLCKCPRRDNKGIRQLRAKLYAVGHDCDVLAEKYNSLLKFVEAERGSNKTAEQKTATNSERQVP